MRKIPADALQSLANFYDQEDWIVQAGNTKKLLTSLVFLKHYTAPSSSPDQPYHVAVAVDSRIVGRHQSHNAHFRGWGQIDKNSGDGSDNQVLAAITLSNDPAIREKVRDLVLHAGEAACPVFDMNGNVGWPKVPYVVGDIHEKLKLHLSQSESIPNQHFLEGVEKENLQIGGKSSEQLLMGLETGGVTLDEELKGILLNKRKFIPTRSPENITLVRLSVADLGFEDGATTLEIYERAYELGLELCQPDTAPTYAVSPNPNIPLFSIRSSGVKFGMKPLGDSKTRLAVFNLMRLESGIHLKLETAPSQREWHETSEWYFCLRKTLST